MVTRLKSALGLRSAHGLVAVFLMTVIVPGVWLTFFGGRALWRERSIAEQELRDRLERGADGAARNIEREVREWRQTLDQVDARPPATPNALAEARKALPVALRRLLSSAGPAVLIWRDGTRFHVAGREQLLYLPAAALPARPAPPLPSEAASAEAAELRAKDYARALSLYQQALAKASPAARLLLQHRIARTLRKTGRREQAVEAYRDLAKSPEGWIGSVPAAVAGRHELCSLLDEMRNTAGLRNCALVLRAELLQSRWPLDAQSYAFYSDAARDWLTTAGGEPDDAAETAGRHKLALSQAVEALVAAPANASVFANGQYFAFRAPAGFPALLLPAARCRDLLISAARVAAADPELDLALEASFESDRNQALAARAHGVSIRPLENLGMPWRLRASLRHPDAWLAGFALRERLYFATLIFVVALLLFGSYLFFRTLRREMEVARLKSDFVSAVSHEFRSPLTGIRQLAEMLQCDRVPSEQRRREYYAMIMNESERLARMVENLLDFSRMEDGRRQYRREPLETSAWLRALAAGFQATAAEKGYRLLAAVPDDLPPLLADGEALSSAVYNLLDNAVKYSPGCDALWLEARAAGNDVTISVRDRGIGIAPEDQKKIFERFFRAGGEIAREVKGVGLGLTLVKHIVEAHDGSVEFESRPGEGSVFRIHLPAGAATPAARTAAGGS